MAECELLDVLKSEEIIAKVTKFLQEGCGCSRGLKGSQCCEQFSKEAVLSNLTDCLELSHEQLDLVLANIQACTNSEIIGGKRKRSSRSCFLYLNCPICKDMFLSLYGISYSQFRQLKEHYEENGLSPKVNGNYKRLPHNTLPQSVTEDVKNFLTNYAKENAVLLPGRIPGFKNDDIRLLSSSETKMNVWRAFETVCEETGKQAVGYTTFTKLWQQFHPDLLITKPVTDLCLTCQQNTSKLLRSANLPDNEKSQCVLAQQEHLSCVQTEREFYRNTCTESNNNLERLADTIKISRYNQV